MLQSQHAIQRQNPYLPQRSQFPNQAGDLIAETTDAIVNAANSQLQPGGGVAAKNTRKPRCKSSALPCSTLQPKALF